MTALLTVVRAAASVAARTAYAMAWLILAIMLVVVGTVIGAYAGISEVVAWEGDILLLGERLTLTGLGELQWHLFAVLVMFGGLHALHDDGHVRVDFIYGALPRRARLAIDVAGHVGLLIPFLAVLIDRSIPSLELAYSSGAGGSDYGGLHDRYLIKAVLPVGFSLILLLAVCQVLDKAIRMVRPDLDHPSQGEAT